MPCLPRNKPPSWLSLADPGATLGDALRGMEQQFHAAGSESPSLDARLLLAHVTGLSRAEMLNAERVLADDTLAALAEVTRRRVLREPVSRIIGQRGFWTLDLKVTPATLDPRPDSETVVEAVLAQISHRDQPLRILDLGTGSGCLLLALLSELPHATGLGLDISAEAVTMAAENAASNGLSVRAVFKVGSWADASTIAALSETPWDIIVSNPPYLSAADMAALEPEVVYDPPAALLAGEEGLDDYRILAPVLRHLVAEKGLVALEVGRGQADSVAILLRNAGFSEPWTRKDLGGIERVVVTKP